MTSLCLSGLPGPIAIAPDVAPIADHLRAVLVGWPEVPLHEMRSRAPFLSAAADGNAVLVMRAGTGTTRREPTLVSAVCTIIIELMDAYVDGDKKLGNLHAGAVEFAGRLVVFPATNRAGKSTLVAAFAAEGHRVFADDLLPVDLDALEAVASGYLPRIRLPLPQSAPETLRRHVADRTILTDDYYAYLQASDDRTVAHGARAPVGAIVLLDRVDQPVEAALAGAEADEALLRVLLQDTKHDFVAQRTFERYLDLVENVGIHRLTYSDIGDAVACLRRAFSHWPEEKPARRRPLFASNRPSAAGEPVAIAGRTPQGRIYRRAEHVIARAVGRSAFLVDTLNNEIHHLDTLGLGLWNLLDKAFDEAMILDIFCGAFPDSPEEVVRKDVREILDTFVRHGLVESYG